MPYVSFYELLCVGGGLAVMSTSVNMITGMSVQYMVIYVIIVLCVGRYPTHSLCRDGTGYFVFPIHWHRSEIPKYAEKWRKKAT